MKTNPQKFQLGERRTMRRAYCVEWSPGKTWAAGTEVEIFAVEPCKGPDGETFRYKLKRTDGTRGEVHMTQFEVKKDTKACILQSLPMR